MDRMNEDLNDANADVVPSTPSLEVISANVSSTEPIFDQMLLEDKISVKDC